MYAWEWFTHLLLDELAVELALTELTLAVLVTIEVRVTVFPAASVDIILEVERLVVSVALLLEVLDEEVVDEGVEEDVEV